MREAATASTPEIEAEIGVTEAAILAGATVVFKDMDNTSTLGKASVL